MPKALLQIAALILKIVDRWLESIDTEEVLNEQFKKALAVGDYATASILLSRKYDKLRTAQKKGNRPAK